MEIDANDLIDALIKQRDAALLEAAQLYAMLQKVNREVEALRKYATTSDAPDTPSPAEST